MARLLVVEDDPAISEPLVRALHRQGHEVELVTTGQQALVAGRGRDLMVLDLGLPDLDGLDVCRRLREAGSAMPVLVLTARATEADLVVGLDAGADDYVTKPFRLSELSARIRALLRRTAPDQTLVVVDDLVIDNTRHGVRVGEATIALTPKEYDLLELLARRVDRVVDRQEIMRTVWQTSWYGNTKTLDMHVSSLRRKLGAAGARIVTVRGVGLRYESLAGRVGASAEVDLE